MKGTPFKTIGAATGIAAGALFVHPYMMLVLSLFTSHGKLDIEPGVHGLSSFAHLIFSRQMLPMSFTFISLCGVAGLLAGMVIERKRRLVTLRYENEKRESVLLAVRQLVMVLSHYFLNAALVTEADVKRLKKDGGIDARNEALDEIEARARKTESVIGLLRDIDFEKLLDGSDPGYKKMLEINSEIEKRLR